MNQSDRRPIQPIGPAVDPWEGHPLFPIERWRYVYVLPGREGTAPVVPGAVYGQGRSDVGRHRRRITR
jgi:hypothetical protein